MLISMSTFTMGWHASKGHHISMLWNASVYPRHDSLTQPGWWKLSQPGQANVSYIATKNVKRTTAKFHSTTVTTEKMLPSAAAINTIVPM